MPTVATPVLDLAIPASPPSPVARKKHAQQSASISTDPNYVGLIPIELCNGCSEEGCSIESDDTHLTNAVRRHFLEYFGHRNLEGMVSSYAKDAVLVHVVNGERKSFHGRDEIRKAFEEIFKLHPTVNSTFELKHIVIHGRNAMVVWSAATPTHIFPQSSDTLLFDAEGRISKQFFNCQMQDLYKDKPWYVDDE